MMIKYRAHEVAKDLGKPSKEVLDLLGKYFEEPKNHMTALTDEELSVVFEYFTQKDAVKSFDEYFASGKKDEKKADGSQDAQKKTQTQPRAKQSGRQQGDRQQKTQRQGGRQPQQRQARAEASSQPQKQEQQEPKGAGGQQQEQRRPQVRTKGEMRHVNTRSSHVELDKYNERYEQIAPDKAVRDQSSNKQKITQRSRYDKGRYKKGKKETEAERLKRIALERQKKPQLKVSIPDEITVGDFAALLKVTAAEIIKKLMIELNIMATVNDTIDYDTAEIIATYYNAKVEHEVVVTIEDRIIDDSDDDDKDLVPRSPVVVVMGHVDHGKTSLLDAIRHSSVTETEAGGITQHIGAYRVDVGGKEITFLDTPGHAAFTSMRARGAQATDIAILVVAADDGIMPQTVEAINHAKAANVSIIVAINKMDKPGANPDRVLQQLTEHELVPEEWGGDIICVPVSAKQHTNIDKLLETVLIVAEMKELKANPNRMAKGIVIEARIDRGRGPIATLLVQNGTLHTSDVIVAGTSVGRVRVMTDDRGKTVTEAGPSVPVEVTGLTEVPQAGDSFNAVSDERLARELVEERKQKRKDEEFKAIQKVTLDNLFSQMQMGEIKTLDLIVKGDVQGSVEAVKQSLEKLSNDEVQVKVIHCGVGAINESDVMLANASNAIIIGFNVRPDPAAKESAEINGVEIRTYRIIYDCIEEISQALKGMLAPKYREVQIGTAEVRQTIKISNVGTIAGSYVTEGKIARHAQIRVVRDGIVVAEDEIDSLRRFKDDVKEVAAGFECGVGLQKFNDIHEGDVLEAFIMEEYRD